MALGFCPAFLMHMKYVAGENAPETKVTPSGFLAALLEEGVQAQPMGDPFTLSNAAGHIKDLRLKYYTRTVPAQMQTTDSCDIDQIPAYDEVTIDSTDVVKFAIHLNDETIARYCDEASRTVAVGGAPTAFMEEQLAVIMAAMNGFIGKIDQTLLSSVTWGTNQVTGNNSAVTVNFNNDVTVNLVTEGWTKILQDYAMNEGFGTPIVVGSGISNAFRHQLTAGVTNMAQVNNNALYSLINYYHDINSATSWGANQFGVFQKGSIGLVQLDEYVGFRAGVKGTSTFFNAALPLALPGAGDIPRMLNVDFQFKYNDCPTEATVGYETESIGRGYTLIMKKNFALWQIPSDAYQASDRLTGNNGSLRYTATNL